MQQGNDKKTRIAYLMEKCENDGFDSLSDFESSELFLAFASGANDSRELLDNLSENASSSFFGLSRAMLTKNGANEAAAFLIDKFPDISARVLSLNSKSEFKKLDITTAAGQNYYLENLIKTQYIGVKRERALLLLFNNKARIICMKFLGSGTNDSLVLDIPKICSICSETTARYCVIAHNHPSGITEPSRADCLATLQLYGALKVIGVTLIDHYIVTNTECRSIRETFDYLGDDLEK